MLNAKEIDRLNALYEDAVNWYLDDTDFNPSDWLDESEGKEYADLADRDN